MKSKHQSSGTTCDEEKFLAGRGSAMEAIQFLKAFGVDVERNGQMILQKKARMHEQLARGGHKRDVLRSHSVRFLLDLWHLKCIPCDARDKTARTIELVIKSLLQDISLPSIDWKKVANEADRFEDAQARQTPIGLNCLDAGQPLKRDQNLKHCLAAGPHWSIQMFVVSYCKKESCLTLTWQAVKLAWLFVLMSPHVVCLNLRPMSCPTVRWPPQSPETPLCLGEPLPQLQIHW